MILLQLCDGILQIFDFSMKECEDEAKPRCLGRTWWLWSAKWSSWPSLLILVTATRCYWYHGKVWWKWCSFSEALPGQNTTTQTKPPQKGSCSQPFLPHHAWQKLDLLMQLTNAVVPNWYTTLIWVAIANGKINFCNLQAQRRWVRFRINVNLQFLSWPWKAWNNEFFLDSKKIISSKNEFPNFPTEKQCGKFGALFFPRLKKNSPSKARSWGPWESMGLLAETEFSAQSVRSRFQFLQNLRPRGSEKSVEMSATKTWLEKVTPY